MIIPVLRLPFSSEDSQVIAVNVSSVISSGILTQGKFTQEFEQRFAKFCGVKHAIAVNSCTAGLEVILRGLEIEGKSVIVPTNTFMATALAVVHSGNRVVFADCEPATLALDPDDLPGRIKPDTAAVIVVHIGGIVSPKIDSIRRFCWG